MIVIRPKKKKARKTSIPALTKKAQEAFNGYVRRRDSEDGYFTCICCNRTFSADQMNAGHYVPVGRSSALRFEEDNVHGQSAGCNCFDAFHLVGYRKNLIEKIGLGKVEELEQRSRETKKWTREELYDIINTYKDKI